MTDVLNTIEPTIDTGPSGMSGRGHHVSPKTAHKIKDHFLSIGHKVLTPEFGRYRILAQDQPTCGFTMELGDNTLGTYALNWFQGNQGV